MTKNTTPLSSGSRLRDHTLILNLTCPDQTGLVAAVTGFIAHHGGWILSSDNHSDTDLGLFFMREEIVADSLAIDLDTFRSQFSEIAARYDMSWSLNSSAQRKQIAIFATNAEHCLYDLFGRARAGELAGDIACVIANRDSLRDITEWHGIPFFNIGDADGRCDYEHAQRLLHDYHIDVIVLARFMQIFPEWLCREYAGRVINIHHSFLPSFKGARPYEQAHRRGVKLIGATCHYVTTELDEGPIIEQDVARVDHSDSVAELQRAGKDIEKAVLARGLRWHLEDRVFISGARTIVFT